MDKLTESLQHIIDYDQDPDTDDIVDTSTAFTDPILVLEAFATLSFEAHVYLAWPGISIVQNNTPTEIQPL